MCGPGHVFSITFPHKRVHRVPGGGGGGGTWDQDRSLVGRVTAETEARKHPDGRGLSTQDKTFVVRHIASHLRRVSINTARKGAGISGLRAVVLLRQQQEQQQQQQQQQNNNNNNKTSTTKTLTRTSLSCAAVTGTTPLVPTPTGMWSNKDCVSSSFTGRMSSSVRFVRTNRTPQLMSKPTPPFKVLQKKKGEWRRSKCRNTAVTP